MHTLIIFILLQVATVASLGATVQRAFDDPPQQEDIGKVLNVPIVKVVSGNIIHRFHDTSPISPSGRYIALFRLPFDDRYPKEGEAGQVVLVDLQTGEQKDVAQSYGWEMQVGANVQWGASDHELFFNQVDTSTWDVFTVKYDPLSGESVNIKGSTFMVSQNGKKIVSHNLINSVYAQSGYGVIVPEYLRTRNRGLSDNDGIFVTEISAGETKLIASIKRIFDEAVPSIGEFDPSMFEIYGFKAMWNPQMTRIMTCLIIKPIEGGKRKVAVVTMKPDGSDIRTAINTEQYAKGGHHMAWMPDGERFSMNLEVDGDKEGLELITVKYDGSELTEVFASGSGHPSFNPSGAPFIITDAYRHETRFAKKDGYVPLRLLNVATGKEWVLAQVKIPDVEDSSFRLDPHPTWDRSGRYVIFNSYEDGSRGVYIADLKEVIEDYKNIGL